MSETCDGKKRIITREALQFLTRDDLIDLVLWQATVIEEQRKRILLSEQKVVRLEERTEMNSRNSSKPPSSDSPWMPPRTTRKPSGRAPGGQAGHERATRPLIPIDKVDEVIPLKPEHCEGCGQRLHGKDPMPRRWQVTDIPKVKPSVTEYQQHTLTCACGHQTTAALPEVAANCFGPRVESTAALLTGAYHVSKRSAQEILRDLFGVEMSLGALSRCEENVGTLLDVPVTEALMWVQEQSVAHADETGWKERRCRAWLWVLSTAAVTVFRIHARRTKEAAMELLGRFAGTLHTDRWGAYNIYKGLRQICWAHLLRDFKAFSEYREPSAGRVGKGLLKKARRLLKLWGKVRDGTWGRDQYRRSTTRLKTEIENLLREGADCRHATMRRQCRMILKHGESLWTFMRVDDVEPTNNAAERSIRPAVLWRRKSFGTQSARGSRFVERMLTVTATLRQQNRNVTDYLSEVCASALTGHPLPSLLPISKAS